LIYSSFLKITQIGNAILLPKNGATRTLYSQMLSTSIIFYRTFLFMSFNTKDRPPLFVQQFPKKKKKKKETMLNYKGMQFTELEKAISH